MDLFVVNRHKGDENGDETQENREQTNLNKVLNKIEHKKKMFKLKIKERKAMFKKMKRETMENRHRKRVAKAEIIQVPENEAQPFIDPNLVDDSNDDDEENVPEKPNNQQTLAPSSIEGFTILGDENFTKRQKVKRVLPRWLAAPTIISVNLQQLTTKVSSVKQLDKQLRQRLKRNGIKYFFPVQAEVIPWLLGANRHSDCIFPRDVCVSAPTGSGKTLAFVLPVVQALKRHTFKRIRALVILPTQDLALQVFKTFQTYAQGTNIDVGLASGRNTFEMEQTQLVYENEAFGVVSKVDILVCTAGRLVDHLKSTNGFDLHNLEFLVIDEADRVLENMQNDWFYHLENHIHANSNKILNLFTLEKHRPPQKLLFSATLSQDPEKLQMLSLFQPKLFTSVMENVETDENVHKINTFIGKYTTPMELEEKYIVTNRDLLPLVLYKFINDQNLTKTLIFTNSIESVHRLTILLRSLFDNKLKIEEISSNLQAVDRTDLTGKFSSGQIDLLVCTDALTRGIDLPGVQCVISYSAPKYLKTYIHRAGRTARAGQSGLAVTLLTQGRVKTFLGLLQQAGKKNVGEMVVAVEDLEPLGEKYKESLDELKKIITNEEKTQLEKMVKAKKPRSLKRKRKNSIKNNKTR